jgi:hypothetical protein
MGHTYVQGMLGANAGSSGFTGMSTTRPGFQLELLSKRAVNAGLEDGFRHRSA